MADGCNRTTDGINFQPSTIETVDSAMLSWIKAHVPSVETKQGTRVPPILWATAERSYQVKNDADIRDENGMMIYPVITLQRTSMDKSLTRRVGLPNTFATSGLGGSQFQIGKVINQEKSKNFANQDSLATGAFDPLLCNNRVVYDVYSTPAPVWVNVNYKITFRSEFQQQMNDMVLPYIIYPRGINEIIIAQDGHSFPAFVQETISSSDNVTDFTEDERVLETSYEIKVLAYFVGDKSNPARVPQRRETIVSVEMPRETSIIGEMSDYQNLFGVSAMRKFSESCCPTASSSLPQRFGRPGPDGQIIEQVGGGGNINIVQVERVVDDRIGEVLIFREFLNQVGNNVVGNGNLDFATTNRFKIGSESLYINGILLYPGATNDYIVWDGSIPGKPPFQGITIISQRPVAQGGIGIDPDWEPPQTAEEKGHQANANDGIVDDILLISYIKA